MAKQLSTGAKVAIWIGVLATVGVSGYFIYEGYKKWKARKGSSETDDTGINFPKEDNSKPITTTDPTVPVSDKEKSYNEVKTKLLSLGAKDYGDYVMYTVPTSYFAEKSTVNDIHNWLVGLSGYGTSPYENTLGGRVSAKFQKNTGYRLYFTPTGKKDPLLLHGGLYWNGGKTLKVYNDYLNKGKNKGLIVTATDPLTALKKASI